MGRAYVSFDELHTLLVEMESIVNDRPLTYASGDLEDLEPLTQSQLLTGRRNKLFPDCSTLLDLDDPDYVRQQTTAQALVKRSAYLSKIVNDFFKRWTHEYLTSLREFQTRNKGNATWPSQGDIVLIPDEGPRTHWKLGRVLQLMGDSEQSRVVKVKYQGGVTVRPLAKIYPLELQEENNTIESDKIDANSLGRQTRPPRKTAQAATKLWKGKIAAGDL